MMKYITFTASDVLAGLANMLSFIGYDLSDEAIALGMEAPYLFLHENGRYFAGSGLYGPQWINLFLGKHGLRLTKIPLPKSSINAFLRSQKTVMLSLALTKGAPHLAVFSSYTNGRYEFTNVKPVHSAEPDTFSLTGTMLQRRLPDQVCLYTLEACTPAAVDFTPLLLESLTNLDAYLNEVLQARERTVTRAELSSLHNPLFRALMQDLQPMAALIGDLTLADELRLLNHDYRHIFTRNSPNAVPLSETLPKGSIKKCVAWLKEDIIDRLYELGIGDDQTDSGNPLAK